jgi:hypothetical protein
MRPAFASGSGRDHADTRSRDRAREEKDVIRVASHDEAAASLSTDSDDVSIHDAIAPAVGRLENRADLTSETEVGVDQTDRRALRRGPIVTCNHGLERASPLAPPGNFSTHERRRDHLATATVRFCEQSAHAWRDSLAAQSRDPRRVEDQRVGVHATPRPRAG